MAMFGNGFGLVDQNTARTADYGLPQLSGDVVAAGQAQAQPGRWLDGGKFTAKDAIGLALGAIGDAFSGQNNTANMVNRSFQQQRQLKLAQQQRQQEMDDWQHKQMWERANPEPSPILRDVAAYQALSPEQRTAYGELQDLRAGPTTVQLPNGFVYSGPRSGIGAALGGGQPQAESQPTMQNTPAPALGGNGLPQFLTPDQYQATVQAMGREKTDAWLSKNNIPVGKSVGGKTYYQINGKWYDNPEGR